MYCIPLYSIICDVLLLTAVWLPVPLLKYHTQPYHRGFFCNDESIRYPYKDSTVTSAMLYSVGYVLPVLSIMAVEAYRTFVYDPRAFQGGEQLKPRYSVLGRPVHVYLSSLYVYIGYFFFGVASTMSLTDMGKVTFGRLRPHFIHVCQPDLSCKMDNLYDYIQHFTCNGTDQQMIHEARLSFPSGHSSFSGYTMIYLILYLHARLIFPIGGVLSKHVFQFIALALTLETCLTRVTDFKHHWSDVVAGFILGAVTAIVTACYIVGLFRRPHWVFAQSNPYDARNFTGAQLCHNSTQVAVGAIDGTIPVGKSAI